MDRYEKDPKGRSAQSKKKKPTQQKLSMSEIVSGNKSNEGEKFKNAPLPSKNPWGINKTETGSETFRKTEQSTESTSGNKSNNDGKLKNVPIETNPWGNKNLSAPASSTNPWGQKHIQTKTENKNLPETSITRNKNLETGMASLNIKKTMAGDAKNVTSSRDNEYNTRRRKYDDSLVRSFPANTIATKQGTSGQIIPLMANSFRIVKTLEWQILQYRIDFAPEVGIRIAKSIVRQNKDKFGANIFDGQCLFTIKKLENFEFLTKLPTEDTIQVTVKYVGTVEPFDGHVTQIYNIIIRKCMAGLNLMQIGRNNYDPTRPFRIMDHKIELWPGFVTSIRQYENDLMLTSDLSYKVIATQTLNDVLSQFYNSMGKIPKDIFEKKFIGMVVFTSYSNQTHKVIEIDWNKNPQSKFLMQKTGKEISFIEYFSQKYNINIRDKNQPLLVCRPTEKKLRAGENPTYNLIPEMCTLTGFNDDMRKNHFLMKAVADHTSTGTKERIERLLEFQRNIGRSQQSMESLSMWNLNIDNKFVEFKGRQLKHPEILFGKGIKIPDWSKKSFSNPMFQNITLSNWCVIFPSDCAKSINEFIRILIEIAKNMNMTINKPNFYEIPNDSVRYYTNQIDVSFNADPQLLVCILSRQSDDKYRCIKKKCIIERNKPSQVILKRNVEKHNPRSIITKLVIQINTKLNGSPWKIAFPSDLMCIGFDVCHSTMDRTKSYGAMVATMDQTKSGRFFSQVSVHEKGAELSNDIQTSALLALREYLTLHKNLPKFIVFYRDGVGEGQLHTVFECEVKALQNAFNKEYVLKTGNPNAKCLFAFIVVSKRLIQKIFTTSGFNPPQGTIVDDVITMPERCDFYLISQQCSKGTASPTNYNVLFNSLNIPIDKLQILTNQLCHLYYNWEGAIKVPSVCQYAHKLAFLVGQTLHIIPPLSGLEKSLYFI